MKDNEQKLSDYIDRLNAEQKPDEEMYSTESAQLEELYETVRLVRSLKEPSMPGPQYQKTLVQAVTKQQTHKHPAKHKKWGWFISAASVAAIFALLLNFMLPFGNTNVVYAMEKAFQEVEAYHGTLEVVETNANGESTKQAIWDVWADQEGHYYIKGLEGSGQDLITVNNGQQKWQIQPEQKQVQIFPAFPDAYRFQFELGEEIQDVKNALSTKEVGEATISGRETSILEVTPEGGLPYRIWIDEETKLPLQKQTAMNHAIQYTITYTQIDFTSAIPNQLRSYQLPEGFNEINANPEQLVSDLNEAQELAGFVPEAPEAIPSGYLQDRLAVIPNQHLVKIYYTTNNDQVILEQSQSINDIKPAPNAIIGKMNGSIVEILSPVADDSSISSIRWLQDGIEFTLLGETPIDDLVSFAESIMNGPLEMPSLDKPSSEPQVDVDYDLTIEKNDQKNVDSGSSPWRLDPVYSTQIFVSLLMSPEGITGEYPIDIEDLAVLENDGKKAIVSVSDDQSPTKQVYLERLVRQDSTGIWTVVGYDPN